MLAEKFALSDYLSFLGWKGEGAPQVTYDTLEQIHLLHSTKIPFDNFDMYVHVFLLAHFAGTSLRLP